jgi:hypothetical protein
MNKRLLVGFCAALFSLILVTADLALARGGGQGGCGFGSGTRAGQPERLRKRDGSCTQFDQTRSQTRQTLEDKDKTGQGEQTNQGTETVAPSDQSDQPAPTELNDHRLKDGGFVNRLKPTKVIKEKTIFCWLMTCSHIADFFFA